MLKLILGRAKSGKTAAIMEDIRRRAINRQGNNILLVPEQYSHEAERELLSACGDSMSLYAEVLSFSRLATRVETELGFRQEKPLDSGGRLLCMALALEAVGSRLKVYGSARRQPQLQATLLSAIDELKTSCITPEALSLCAEGRIDALSEKLRDMSLIYGAYCAIVSQGRLDPTDRLDHLADDIGRSSLADGAFYIDGFTDFTMQEKRVIDVLLASGADITVCLTCESLTESHEIFEPSRRAANDLSRMCSARGATPEVIIMPETPTESPMDFLEQKLFGFSDKKFDAKGSIKLSIAPGITAECEAAAARCVELVRDTGCRWRDIAIAARGYDTYRAALESIFSHYGVPLFSASKSDIMEKPVPALLAAAFDVIFGGWSYDDMFTYLKTGLAGLTREECDTLENYVFLWSIHGNAWTKAEDWRLHPEGFDADYTDETWETLRYINSLRRKAAAPLIHLAERGRNAKSASKQALAAAEFLMELKLPEALSRRAKELSQRGLDREAAEYSQLWDIIVGALEQCADILGETEMDQETFGRLFCLVLSGYDVGTIPLSLDKVSAGDMDRMRRRNIKHLLVLGCDSGSMPRSEPSSGIFSDDDRVELISAGIDIGDTAPDRLCREFALMYNCLTLPSDTLYMSWCQSGEEGAANQPSFIVSRAEKLFGVAPQVCDIDLCRTNALSPAFELASRSFSAANSSLSAAARRYFRENGGSERLEKLHNASALTRGQLSRSAVRALYGDRLRLSASRIDKFSSCRFSYFMQYGLKAKPRQAAQFAPPEMGTFMHYVLQNVASEISAIGGFASVSAEKLDELCDKYVEQYIHDTLNDFREKSSRFIYLFRRLTLNVRRVVADMVSELSRSDFKPLDFELDFGNAQEFPPIELGEGEDSLTLTGIADRIDGWLHDGKLYIRVVDYKTGKKKFSLSDVWYGMGLQMLLYLFALQRTGRDRYGSEIVPAGVLYVPARDVLVSAKAGMSAEEISVEKLKSLRRSGLLLDDENVLNAMEHGGDTPLYIPVTLKNGAYSGEALASAERLGQLSAHIDETLRALAAQLRGGSIAADPYFRTQTENACAFCDYREACHFDEASDCVRYLRKMKSGEVWEKLQGGGEEK